MYQHSSDEVLVRLIELAGEVPGKALLPLRAAELMKVPLTLDVVNAHTFDV